MGSFPGQALPSGGVKSVQRGTVNLTIGGTSTANITISPVKTNKSVLVFNSSGTFNSAGTTYASATASGILVDSTTVQLSANGGGVFNGGTVTVNWQVVEYF